MIPAKRNVLVLAVCQTLFGSGRSLLISSAPLIAYTIAAHKELATLPQSLVIVGTALSTFPASLLMRRIGRRSGFMLGTTIGLAGGLVAAYAVLTTNFWLFALGTLMFGLFAGFGQFYRFAAADLAGPDFRSRAISLVLAGGVIAGFAGPELAKFGRDMFGPVQFVGSYLLLAGTMAIAALVLLFLHIPPLTRTEQKQSGRPLGVIMGQPVFIAATLSAVVAQGVMNFLMTATPIAMVQHSHHFDDTALVIEWHVVGMFAPGFITGSLIKRFGELRMITAGLTIQLLCVLVALSGDAVWQFWLSMALLGLGWNFAFTASTALMTTAYTPAERGKTEGALNLIIYGVVSVLSLSSGALIHYFGWRWVNLGSLPLLLVAASAMVWYTTHSRRHQAAPAE